MLHEHEAANRQLEAAACRREISRLDPAPVMSRRYGRGAS